MMCLLAYGAAGGVATKSIFVCTIAAVGVEQPHDGIWTFAHPGAVHVVVVDFQPEGQVAYFFTFTLSFS